LALSRASKLAETSVIMPVDFVRIVWAFAIGSLLFGDRISSAVFAGAMLIFAGACIAAIFGKQAPRPTVPGGTAPDISPKQIGN
jgi:drug/metabolite transporter (DMT)-like permease